VINIKFRSLNCLNGSFVELPKVFRCRSHVFVKNCLHYFIHSKTMEVWDFVEFTKKKIKKEDCFLESVIEYVKRHQSFCYIPLTKTLYTLARGRETDLSLTLDRSMMI